MGYIFESPQGGRNSHPTISIHISYLYLSISIHTWSSRVKSAFAAAGFWAATSLCFRLKHRTARGWGEFLRPAAEFELSV